MPELHEKYNSLVYETNPEIKSMLDSVGKTAFLGKQTLKLSSELRDDLSLISLDYIQNLAIVRKFKTTYADHFDSMNNFAIGIMEQSTIKLDCIADLRDRMLEITRIGENIVSDVIMTVDQLIYGFTFIPTYICTLTFVILVFENSYF